MTGNYAYLYCEELGREIGRAISRSPDISRSLDVVPGDLDLALRISNEANSSVATRSGFTNAELKLKIQF